MPPFGTLIVKLVIPAKAGIQPFTNTTWIPAFAGMTLPFGRDHVIVGVVHWEPPLTVLLSNHYIHYTVVPLQIVGWAEQSDAQRGGDGPGVGVRFAHPNLQGLTDDLRELIIANAPQRRLIEEAESNGMRSLRQVALDLVRKGETTLEEINRVTFVA